MNDFDAPLVVYVDVDDTLVRTVGTKRIPVPLVIEHVRSLKAQGAEMYCWSSGGAEYARTSASEFGIEDCFTGFLPKPNVVIDDQLIRDWKRFQEIDPRNTSGLTIEDYRLRLDSK
jgi:hypothetical protein